MKKKNNLIILGIFILWRVALFVISTVTFRFFTFEPRFPYSESMLIPSGLPSFLWSFANFDGVHYLTIAQFGYSAQYTQVFFPFYPLLIGLILRVLPFISSIIVGIGLSSIFFYVSLFVFDKLIKLDGIKNTYWIILFLVMFPTSFYFGSIYTESLFLLLIISSFYFARKKNWWLASVLGAVASLTRLNGVFLLPALLMEWGIQKKIRPRELTHGLKEIAKCPALYIIPLGLFAYMAYLQIAFGDALYFWHAQPAFGASRTGNSIILLPQVFYRYFNILRTVPLGSEVFFISFSECLFTVLSILFLIASHRKKVHLPYLIFSWFTVLVPTLTGTFSSMPRYVLMAFPMYFYLSGTKSRLLKIIMLTVSFILLVVFTALFARGHWVA